MIKLRLVILALFAVWFSALAISASAVDPSLTVETELGSYRGFVHESVTKKLVKVFYGIPFAERPIGSNRFKPPLPVAPHNATLDCTEQRPACLQKLNHIYKVHPVFKNYFSLGKKPPSEDCLFLNLFIPKRSGAHLPVMVFLYGGGFVVGNSNAPVYDGKTLAAEENVIVVSLNYRVASLGFMYLGMDEAPGNVGLMDQAMAFKWVQDHISSFGGDPKRVTLFGESAGASSISHHILLESSRPLFQRAILQSGVAQMSPAIDSRKDQLATVAELADNVGCPFNLSNLRPALECFASKDGQDLIESEPVYGYGYNFFFKPVVDGKYIKEHPERTIRKGLNFRNLEIISGNNEDEASLFLALLYPFMFTLTREPKPDGRRARQVIGDLLSITNDSVIIDIITSLYGDIRGRDTPEQLTQMAIRAGSDAAFICAAEQFEKALADAKNKVYKYRFKHRDSHILLPKWLGSFHGSELNYIFGEPLDPNGSFESFSMLLSRRMMRYWANFARTGDPNISPLDAPSVEEPLPLWKPLDSHQENCFIFDRNSSSNTFENRDHKCRFWNDIFPEIYRLERQKKFPGKPRIINLDRNKLYT